MKRLFRAPLMALFITAAGCATYTTHTEGPNINSYTVAEIKPGVSTREWVIEKFGKPSRAEFIGEDEILIFEETERRVPSYLSGTLVFDANATVTRNVLDVTIKKGRVSSYRYRSNTIK